MKFSFKFSPKKSDLNPLDAIFLPITNNAKQTQFGGFFKFLDAKSQRTIKQLDLKSGQSKFLRLTDKNINIFIVSENQWNQKKTMLAIRKFVLLAKQENNKNLGINLDDLKLNDNKIISEAALMANYDFSQEFKAKPKTGWKKVQEIIIFSSLRDISQAKKKNKITLLKNQIKEGQIIGQGVNSARTLSNYPPSEMSPEALVEAAKTISNQNPKIKVTVFDEKKLKDQGMNAILAVGRGSRNPSRLIILEYQGLDAKTKPLALVGKGITFDSGGLNLKPGDSMSDMHMDMSGGSAVLYATQAIANLEMKVNIIALIPAAENMPGGLSYRQNDIIKAYGGKTIEIGNTDAEGRVVLADAIEYAKTKKPSAIFSIATLTGAAVVALGQRMSALFVKNNKELRQNLEQIGENSGDYVWPLPLTEDNEKEVEGNFADVTNTHKNNSRWGGASSAAGFLSHFAGKTNFAHIDMAPRMTTLPEEEFLTKGAAGFGVRYFVELAKNWEKISKTLL